MNTDEHRFFETAREFNHKEEIKSVLPPWRGCEMFFGQP
jgi:hypothetical protein